jgi:hypothetical protein
LFHAPRGHVFKLYGHGHPRTPPFEAFGSFEAFAAFDSFAAFESFEAFGAAVSLFCDVAQKEI